jgi:hypothetical protein
MRHKNCLGDFGKFERLLFYVNVEIEGFFILLDRENLSVLSGAFWYIAFKLVGTV